MGRRAASQTGGESERRSWGEKQGSTLGSMPLHWSRVGCSRWVGAGGGEQGKGARHIGGGQRGAGGGTGRWKRAEPAQLAGGGDVWRRAGAVEEAVACVRWD
jgi:hypothetical protein